MRLFRRLGAAVAIAVGVVAWGGPARGQALDMGPPEAVEAAGEGGLSAADEARLQLLSDPEALKKKSEARDREKPPLEIYRSQIAPNDVIPWIKANQWTGLVFELQANLGDYDGAIRSLPVPLIGPPNAMVYARDARLVMGQRSALGMSILLPRIPKDQEMLVELRRPDAIRADELYSVPLRRLPPHQMLVMVLSKEPNDVYAGWSRFSATIPATFDPGDTRGLDAARYYRLLLPLNVDRPFLPAHPLTWGAISHVVWDGMAPDVLSSAQQSALVDWLHWGGQLVVIGGAGPKFSIFRESFLDPYLPADPTGDGRLLGAAELAPLSESYRPPFRLPADGEVPRPSGRTGFQRLLEQAGTGYRAPEPIRPAADRPVYVAGLRPREGATTIPLGAGGPDLLAVESRVGRGRITMLTVNPTEPALAAWEGLDTMVRRVVLRRAEEAATRLTKTGESGSSLFANLSMGGPDLSWYRIAARDVGARAPSPPEADPGPIRWGPTGRMIVKSSVDPAVVELQGVAEWFDGTAVPVICRGALERASGITVPSSQFVLKVILAYLLAVVPLNWLACRYVLRRREAAWVVVPLLALGFAVGVERGAAYDMGYDSACDEIDLLEVQGAYPRGHLSRFASIYTTGRGEYAIRFPDDPTALALPLDTGRSIAGEDLTTAVWRSYPVPALEHLAVQPRSLSMFRAEEVVPLPGSVEIEADGARRSLRNGLGLELRDATLVDFSDPAEPVETPLGTIADGATVELTGEGEGGAPAEPPAGGPGVNPPEGYDGPDPAELLDALRDAVEGRPEDVGELRLVAWSPGPVAGPSFEPALDRHRGATVVVVHLRYGPPPSPSGGKYYLTAPRRAGTEAGAP